MSDEKLIEAVRRREFLYNLQHPKYKDTVYKNVAWDQISAEVNQPASLCKSRWQNIRDAYRKFRQRETTTRSGQAAKTDRPFKYGQNLDFLRTFFKERPMLSSLRQDLQVEHTAAGPSHNGSDMSPLGEMLTLTDGGESDADVGHSEEPPRKKRKKELQRNDSLLLKNLEESNVIFKKLVETKETPRERESSMALLGRSIFQDIERLSPGRQLIVKKKLYEVQFLVDDLLEQQLQERTE